MVPGSSGRHRGRSARIKTNWDKDYCFAKNPGEAVPRGLALRVVEKFLGEDARWEPDGSLTLQGQRIPLSQAGAMLINYAGPAETVAIYLPVS